MAYGRLMLDLAGTELTAEEQQILQSPQVGGVILFARNIQSREQVTALNAQIRQASANLLIAVDQEGGRVQRLRDGFTPLPPMQLLADSVVQNSEVGVQLVRDTGWLMASEVLACGFDISFAPVLDVDRDTSSIIGDRAFSDQPEMVAVALAMAAALLTYSMRCCYGCQLLLLVAVTAHAVNATHEKMSYTNIHRC